MDTVFEKHSKVSFDNIRHSNQCFYLFDNFNVSINTSLHKKSLSMNILGIQINIFTELITLVYPLMQAFKKGVHP